MYAFLRGKVAEKRPDSVVLDVGGVGYIVYTNTAAIAKAEGDRFTLHTHLIVRDDAMDIYGFLTKAERDTFVRLLSVPGVGAKSALAVLTQMTVEQFQLALVTQDAKAIAKAPSIGNKTAQKIILELKDRVTQAEFAASVTASAMTDAGGAQPNEVQDAIDALIALGYQTGEAAAAVNAVKGQGQSADELIRLALKRFV